MNSKIINKSSVTAGLAEARVAFQAGKLTSYTPLTACGSGRIKSTIAAAWGPMMRK